MYIILILFILYLILYFIINHNKNDNIDKTTYVSSEEIPLPDKKQENIKEYKIAGVTYKNEDGKDIQKEIKKILKEYIEENIISTDDMFLGYSNSEIKEMALSVSQYEDISFNAKIKEDVFENKPCIKVYIQRSDLKTYTHIGYIQKRYNQIQELLDIIHNYENISLDLYIVGGKCKSCEIETDDEYNEHYYVETINLDYGFRLFVTYN